MKLNIDEKKCNAQELTIWETMILFAIKAGHFEKDVGNLLKKEVLKKDKGKFLISPDWKEKVNNLFIKCGGNVDATKIRCAELAEKMQKAYVQGRQAGTVYYYPCNKSEITNKLIRFFANYGDYTDAEILNAEERYINSFDGDYRYLPLLKYFISKVKPIADEDGQVHNTEVSDLATYLENADTESNNIDEYQDPFSKMV